MIISTIAFLVFWVIGAGLTYSLIVLLDELGITEIQDIFDGYRSPPIGVPLIVWPLTLIGVAVYVIVTSVIPLFGIFRWLGLLPVRLIGKVKKWRESRKIAKL